MRTARAQSAGMLRNRMETDVAAVSLSGLWAGSGQEPLKVQFAEYEKL